MFSSVMLLSWSASKASNNCLKVFNLYLSRILSVLLLILGALKGLSYFAFFFRFS